MSSSTKIISKLYKTSTLGIGHVKNYTNGWSIPLKELSEEYQVIHSEVLNRQPEEVVYTTRVKESIDSVDDEKKMAEKKILEGRNKEDHVWGEECTPLPRKRWNEAVVKKHGNSSNIVENI